MLDRRFKAYEEALNRLAWGSDHFWTDGDPDHPDIVQVGEAMAAVMVYGSPAASKAVALAAEKKDGEGWAQAYDRARMALAAVATVEVHRFAPSVADPVPEAALDGLFDEEEA